MNKLQKLPIYYTNDSLEKYFLYNFFQHTQND